MGLGYSVSKNREQIKICVKADKDIYQDNLTKELDAAIHAGDPRMQWETIRKIAGLSARSSRPSSPPRALDIETSEWDEHMSKVFGATKVDNPKCDRVCWADANLGDAHDFIDDNWDSFMKSIKKLGFGKAYPSWSLPPEIWRLICNLPKNENGFEYPDARQLVVAALMSRCDRSKMVPACWAHSDTFLINKGRGSGTTAERIINKLDPLGRAYIGAQHLLDSVPQAPWQHGFSKGKSTIDAIALKSCIWDRAKNYRLSSVEQNWDIAQAFDEMDRDKFFEVAKSYEIDTEQFENLYENSHMQIEGNWYHTKKGAPQGGTEGPKSFSTCFDHVMGQWKIPASTKTKISR